MEVLKQLHASVAQAFADHFENAYRDLHQELALRDAKVQAAEETTRIAEEARKRTTVEIVTLKDEIALLQDELCLSDVGPKEDRFTAEKSLELEATYAPHHVLEPIHANRMGLVDLSSADMKAINNKYTSLYREAMTLMKASGDLRKQVKRHKRKLAHLRKSLDRDRFTLVLDGVAVDFKRVVRKRTNDDRSLSPTTTSSYSLAESSRSVTHTVMRDSTSVMDTSQPDIHDLVSEEDVKNKLEGSSKNPCRIPLPETTSTQSGRSNPDEVIAPAQHASTASVGSLKRKRLSFPIPHREALVGHGDVDADKNRGSAQPTTIKNESLLSSPLQTSLLNCGVIGMQDLDEIGATVETPTKEKKYKDGQFRQAASPTLDLQRICAPHIPRRPTSNHLPLGRPTVLQSVDGNITTHMSAQLIGKSVARGTRRTSKCPISSITEDGEEDESNPAIGNKFGTSTFEAEFLRPNPDNDDQMAAQRLEGLLEGPLPAKQHLWPKEAIEEITGTITRHTSPPSTRQDLLRTYKNNAGAQLNMVPEKLEESPESNLRHGSNQVTPSSRSEAERMEMDPVYKTYRTRPLHRLELSHFKINPDYNQGVDFAFSSVIRRMDERKCANGCTRPSCCGSKFHAMARLGGLPSNVTSLKEREQENRKILEDYLGNENHLLDGLSVENQAELLQAAKARLIANRYGKHRHHHQRLGSPPGYWRTDMPDTQELQRDHEEAREIERERVEDRYREAMRPGGLWKFADE
ncbi:SAE2-domain-containing protein [Aspergillus sclerotioniger CBS 115572]|uniref:SAE2-domain-containing protein n=1 Tax=Aspergillus sclerotioniger CBS 115572 TaxID=1450535 RepID=A0A317W2J5_9EURO|nr:SAE2-domain-containing protein [Aspergillus sclerotioniger CBS 115572]PWY78400.1 SAE2-domain-containing protein [Aspergillus sclerotioniger CBS 115572]